MAEDEAKLKEVEYVGFGSSRGKAVYYVADDGRVYFSGLNTLPSTINLAEKIIEAVYLNEGWKEPDKLSWRGIKIRKFVDIQTHLGYSSKKPGHYEADLLQTKKVRIRKGEIPSGGLT
ncbi:MAG: hypothetical protein U1C56_01070, partial [Candidatus Curtissbacteria bacterium]|nr:hypothetical protein [Candidatus Curtissbacteria bacterium]